VNSLSKRLLQSRETETHNPAVYQEIMEVFPDTPVEKIPHVEFKRMLGQVKAIIRTGEFTPYANVILVGGSCLLAVCRCSQELLELRCQIAPMCKLILL
jgi:D-ribose pyranose/furanose isomerase RbsD